MVRSLASRADHLPSVSFAVHIVCTRCGYVVLPSVLPSRVMAQREKRSISLPPDLAAEIDRAAAAEGTTVSAWIADTAAHRLRLEAGRRGIAEWERQHGALTADELADGLARARAVLGRGAPKRKAS